MIAHVAGVPVEELVPLLAAADTGLLVWMRPILHRARRWVPGRYS